MTGCHHLILVLVPVPVLLLIPDQDQSVLCAGASLCRQCLLLMPGGSDPAVFCSSSERRVDSNDRVYFVNHNTKTTQWEDPRTQG